MTERDEQVLLEIFRNEIRWYHFVTPEARNIVTDRVRTAAVKRLAAAGKVDIGTAEPGSYSVPSLIPADVVRNTKVLTEAEALEWIGEKRREWAEGPGSTSPESGPAARDPWISAEGGSDGEVA